MNETKFDLQLLKHGQEELLTELQRLRFVGSSRQDSYDEDEGEPGPFSTMEDLDLCCQRLEEDPSRQKEAVIDGHSLYAYGVHFLYYNR